MTETPTWTADSGPTATQHADSQRRLKQFATETIAEIIDSYFYTDAYARALETELVSVKKACQMLADDFDEFGTIYVREELLRIAHEGKRSIGTYTNAHLQIALQVLIVYFIQEDPPNYIEFPALNELGETPLIVSVRRSEGKDSSQLLVEKTQEYERLQSEVAALREQAKDLADQLAVHEERLAKNETQELLSLLAERHTLEKELVRATAALEDTCQWRDSHEEAINRIGEEVGLTEEDGTWSTANSPPDRIQEYIFALRSEHGRMKTALQELLRVCSEDFYLPNDTAGSVVGTDQVKAVVEPALEALNGG